MSAPLALTAQAAAGVQHAQVMQLCRATLEANSKTFALAARLLPAAARDKAAALYTYCRSVDDAIDDTPPAQQAQALAALREQLAQAYGEAALASPALQALRAVANATQLPRDYPEELLAGMAMDVHGTRYHDQYELLRYCHRVASVVGLMMCHVLGITRDSALRQAAQLGLAMQLTNICRDVAEDWGLGRLYLPQDMLLRHGAAQPAPQPSGAPPDALRAPMSRVTQELLALADRYYRAAERGIPALPFRAGLAVRAALHMYRAIGGVVAAQGHDPARGRAVVSKPRKLAILLKVLMLHAASLPLYLLERLRARGGARTPRTVLRFPEQLLDT